MPEIDLRGLRAILILEEGQPVTKSLGIGADTRLLAIPSGAIALALRAQKDVLRDKILLGLLDEDGSTMRAGPVRAAVPGDLG
jgi:hypothetical protein